MRTKKTPIEEELDKYYFALNSIKRWQEELGHTTYGHGERTNALYQFINAENEVIRRINALLNRANLTGMEKEYIELKHFKQLNRTQIEREMFCCSTTLSKIRRQALKKIEDVR